jgi:signal transduction histidine kinase
MLAEIESRDTTLTTHNERLEYEVNNRTAHLQKAMQAANLATEAKTNFLSSMSHELRTPLNVIMGFSQLLMSDKDITDPSHQDSLKEIYTAGSHLLNLISDVLDFSKIESGTIELNIQPVSLYDLVDECIRLTSPTSEKYQVQVSIHPSISNDVVLSTDKLRLKQVLINLITNGIKYNHQNGRVTVACEITEHNQCAIKVIDTGIGIKADKLDQIFVAFERLGFESSAIEGTGIGLVLTKQLVELMDGHIHVSSREGEGSTFTISFSGDSLTS